MALVGPVRGTTPTQFAVAAAYAAQGFGYAAIATSLPEFKSSLDLTDTAISLLLLGLCFGAAAGSFVADAVAVWRGSRQALVLGFVLQVIALVVVAFVPPLPVFIGSITVYSLGLGMVDAASNMQGVLAQADVSIPLMGRLYAAYTAAAFGGALAISAFLAATDTVTGALLLAAAVQLVVAGVGWRLFDTERAARQVHTHPDPLPRRPIWIVGLVVLAAFALDSSVATWSSIYLTDALDATKAVAPFGYAAYQLFVLGSRLAADPLVAVVGRARASLLAVLAGFAGTLVVALVPTIWGAVVGFAIAGIGVGILVPVAFSAAGEIMPSRSDEVVARVNVFNYVGVVVGAAALGLVAGASLGPAFLLPGVIVLGAATVARRLG